MNVHFAYIHLALADKQVWKIWHKRNSFSVLKQAPHLLIYWGAASNSLLLLWKSCSFVDQRYDPLMNHWLRGTSGKLSTISPFLQLSNHVCHLPAGPKALHKGKAKGHSSDREDSVKIKSTVYVIKEKHWWNVVQAESWNSCYKQLPSNAVYKSAH